MNELEKYAAKRKLAAELIKRAYLARIAQGLKHFATGARTQARKARKFFMGGVRSGKYRHSMWSANPLQRAAYNTGRALGRGVPAIGRGVNRVGTRLKDYGSRLIGRGRIV
tara:strand:+ start:70560 stop:70892 length:333 start_codon:yes stop_codon:yes gene_type:complete